MSCMPETTPMPYVIMLSIRCMGALSCSLPITLLSFCMNLDPLNFWNNVLALVPRGAPSVASSSSSPATSAEASAAACLTLVLPKSCRILELFAPWSEPALPDMRYEDAPSPTSLRKVVLACARLSGEPVSPMELICTRQCVCVCV